MDSTDLKPCPLCAGRDIRPQAAYPSENTLVCYGCGCSTGLHDAPEGAIAAWNTRSTPSPAQGEVDKIEWCSRCGSLVGETQEWCPQCGETVVRQHLSSVGGDHVADAGKMVPAPASDEREAVLVGDEVPWLENQKHYLDERFPVHQSKRDHNARIDRIISTIKGKGQ